MAAPPKRRPRRGNTSSSSPGWMTTLADMFMLLMTFFILMLSFSSMDAEKYRAMVTSLVEAFNMAPDQMPEPQGLADEDTESPAISEDVPIPLDGAPAAPSEGEAILRDQASAKPARPDVDPGVEQLASMLISEMEEAVSEEQIDVGFDRQRVVIRFNDQATFPVGSAELIPDIRPVVADIVDIVARCDGEVIVTGHTDNRPIVSDRYRSNWDLSAARAVSLVHELVLNRAIPAENVVAAGRAETRPIADNDTAEGREKNRRVEIEIYEPDCDTDGGD
ncbi:flagellar motor protein MotB [Vreelandella utahensis]|uniref:flagellar motor protein MotB n=1 Tax=Vreelandella halophila TaxID=86177 RepID=UPI000984C678|nr:flagellar motor protein MotB [Halomonas utahensis]